jgi:hypothetical protein
MAVVVQYQENRKRVLFRTWTLCDNPNELDTTHWIADELFGTRIDCKNAVSTVSIPHDLEEKLADLPVPISTILKIERGLIRTRPPTTLLRS